MNVIRPGPGIHGYGRIVKEWPKLKRDKAKCAGCRDDFYNGHNELGVAECWGFKTARVVDKVGHSTIHTEGGPDTRMVQTHSCWHAVRK